MSKNQQRNYCKIVVLGEAKVGKSAIVTRFVQNEFIELYDPTIEDNYSVHRCLEGIPTILEIIDTAGSEHFISMRDLYLQAGEGFIIVFSFDSRESFQEVDSYLQRISERKGKGTPCFVIGNKIDLGEREVSFAEIIELEKKWKTTVLYSSAKSNENIDITFMTMASLILSKKANDAGKSNSKLKGSTKSGLKKLQKCSSVAYLQEPKVKESAKQFSSTSKLLSRKKREHACSIM